jgi:cell division protein FtsI/penicillin-binding protein 2
MGRKRWLGGTVALVVALLAAGLAVVTLRRGDPPGPAREVDAYLRAWERFDVAAMGGLTDSPDAVGPAVTAMKEQLGITAARMTAAVVERDGDTARVPFTAQLELEGLGEWRYDAHLDLARIDGIWRVRWSPAALHPQLTADRQFSTTRTWPERAPILGHDGAPLVSNQDVTTVGLKPSGIRDPAQVETTLQRLLGVAPADVRAALAQEWVRPDDFVPIIDVRPARYTPLRPQLAAIDGVFFQPGRSRLGPVDNFAAHVVGTVDEATAERLQELGSPYLDGDRVGLSGLELVHERALAGTPSGEIRLRAENEREGQVLHRFAGTPPQPLGLTLDRAVQLAADQALDGVTKPAALVAIDAGTGEIRGVASRPLSEELNRALAGQYPPGSTFKIVTTAALLGSGLRPEDTVACPAQTTVGQRAFRNFEGGALGSVPFSRAFAESCNTAFASLSTRLAGDALARAATGFGFGSSYDLTLPVGGGKFPAPADAAELAAAAIGQANVEASPVHMASVAAAVSSGTWRPPRLVSGPSPAEAKPLDPAVAETLRQLMVAVVREGSGTGAARPGQVIAGKTGTAEFGSGDQLPTHAWFVGYRGSLAFAVLIEDGGVGGRDAAPIAARFLDAAPR